MPSVTLYSNKTLTGAFQPSDFLMLAGAEMTLFWKLTTTGGPTTVEFYLEFTDDPTGKTPSWFQEVDEQDTGVGVIKMSKTVRTFYENGGAALADGVHRLSTQFVRKAPFGRIQARVTAGAASALVTTPSGSTPATP